jgi:hypothetical protein
MVNSLAQFRPLALPPCLQLTLDAGYPKPALAYLPSRRTPVATENRIRAGADAAMGYPRFAMIDLLKLLGGVFRSHAAREAETAFLRHQSAHLGG